jgi:RNA polymerase sigma-70 factor, ECF subfamily
MILSARLVNVSDLLSFLVVMLILPDSADVELAGDSDAAIRQLHARHAPALRRCAERFGPDRASADDIVQETFIRAWRHLPQLSSEGFPVRPWLFRVVRNLLIDAYRAARSRPVTVRPQPAEEGRDDTGLDRVLDQQIMADALHQLSPAHRAVLVETFYRGRTLAKVARQLRIPDGTARSRLHYALQAQRRELEDREAIEPP